jgi:hypothetical protein
MHLARLIVLLIALIFFFAFASSSSSCYCPQLGKSAADIARENGHVSTAELLDLKMFLSFKWLYNCCRND